MSSLYDPAIPPGTGLAMLIRESLWQHFNEIPILDSDGVGEFHQAFPDNKPELIILGKRQGSAKIIRNLRE